MTVFGQEQKVLTRASADAWSLAVATVHRTVALYRSFFKSFSVFSKTKNHPIGWFLFLAGAEGLEPSARGFGVHPEVSFLVLITVYLVLYSLLICLL